MIFQVTQKIILKTPPPATSQNAIQIISHHPEGKI